MTRNYKIFNDCVHGHMEFHPLCVAIIDTPQFQRLRNIKQLSTTYLVYPGASHNRFEHCLGVSFLAGRMVESLVHNTPGLVISPEEKLSVEIAGLCHDLGHGPFSHTWECFLKQCNVTWKHELGSEQVLDYLIKDNNLGDLFESYGQDPDLIKELIRGEGTILSKEKSFLYQIVANKENDIDVDKWDYFLRDGHQLNIQITYDYRRSLALCRVVLKNGRPFIAFRDKEACSVFDIFRVRADLHVRAYQHIAVKNLELMLIDVFIQANEFYEVRVEDKVFKLSEAHTDVRAFCKLTDHILYAIEYSADPRLGPAQRILQRLHKRQLYSPLGTFNVSKAVNADSIKEKLNEKFAPLEFTTHLFHINLGSCGNPLQKVLLYKKPEFNQVEIVSNTHVDQVLRYLPFNISKFPLKEIQLFCKTKISDEQKMEVFKYLESIAS